MMPLVENIPAPRTQFPLPAITTTTTIRPKATVTASTSSPKESNNSNNYIPLLPKAIEKRSPNEKQQKSPLAGNDNTSTSSSRKRYDTSDCVYINDTHTLSTRTPPVDNQPRKRRDIVPPATADQENVPPQPASSSTPTPSSNIIQSIQYKNIRSGQGVSILETMHRVLREVLVDSNNRSEYNGLPMEHVNWTSAHVFLDKWVDFSCKYGLGYSLTDGTRGAYFNDATSMTTQDDEYVCKYTS